MSCFSGAVLINAFAVASTTTSNNRLSQVKIFNTLKTQDKAILPNMWERTISCSSLSKTYSITGWRLGYIIAPPHIIDVAKKGHDFLTVGAAAPLKEAAVTGLRFGDDYYKWLQDKYTRKRDLFLKELNDLSIAHTVP